jgi:hypothetical protein
MPIRRPSMTAQVKMAYSKKWKGGLEPDKQSRSKKGDAEITPPDLTAGDLKLRQAPRSCRAIRRRAEESLTRSSRISKTSFES